MEERLDVDCALFIGLVATVMFPLGSVLGCEVWLLMCWFLRPSWLSSLACSSPRRAFIRWPACIVCWSVTAPCTSSMLAFLACKKGLRGGCAQPPRQAYRCGGVRTVCSLCDSVLNSLLFLRVLDTSPVVLLSEGCGASHGLHGVWLCWRRPGLVCK